MCIRDRHGGTAQATISITVNSVNDVPLAADDAANTDEDTSVNIIVLTNDTDADGDVLAISEFTQGTHGTVSENADGTVNYTPEANYNGEDSFTYTVSDAHEGSSTATVTVTIAPVNDAPVTQTDTATTDEDVPVTVSVLENDTDPDGDTLTVTSATPNGGGTAVLNPDGTVLYTPPADFNGIGGFTYLVTDGLGGEATGTVEVTVQPMNDPPVAIQGSATAEEDTSIDVVLVATDMDGDPLSFSIVTPPQHGTLGVVYGNHVSYLPDPNYYGPDSFTFRVSDAMTSDEAEVLIAVVAFNDPPALVPLSDQTVLEGEPLAFNLTATDLDGDNLTFTATGLPAGAVLDPQTGAFSWLPTFTQAGNYPVTFVVSDPAGGSDQASLIITVVDVPQGTNHDPDCSQAYPSISEIWPPNHQKVLIDILGVTDADGDPVTVTITKVLQDEPPNTSGDGDTWVDGGGIGTSRAWVRAERVGTKKKPGNGRVYEIFFAVTDGRGGECENSVMVGVPHDQGHGPAIDDGIRYDSTKGQGKGLKCAKNGKAQPKNNAHSSDPDQHKPNTAGDPHDNHPATSDH